MHDHPYVMTYAEAVGNVADVNPVHFKVGILSYSRAFSLNNIRDQCCWSSSSSPTILATSTYIHQQCPKWLQSHGAAQGTHRAGVAEAPGAGAGVAEPSLDVKRQSQGWYSSKASRPRLPSVSFINWYRCKLASLLMSLHSLTTGTI